MNDVFLRICCRSRCRLSRNVKIMRFGGDLMILLRKFLRNTICVRRGYFCNLRKPQGLMYISREGTTRRALQLSRFEESLQSFWLRILMALEAVRNEMEQ